MKINPGYTAALMCLLLFLPQRLTSTDESPPPLVLEGADYIRQKQDDGGTVLILEGSVEWSRGESRLNCDRAKYYEDTGILYLSGDVHVLDEDRNMRADSVKYSNEIEYAVVTGNARMEMTGGDFTILADSIDYSLERGEAWAFKRPELIMGGRDTEEGGKREVAVTGDRFHLLEDSMLAISGDVNMSGDSLLGGADSLYYDIRTEKIFLTGAPWIEVGAYRLEGESLELSVPEQALERGISKGGARGEHIVAVEGQGEEAEEKLLNWIEADTIAISFKDDRIDSLVASREARSFYAVLREGELEENYAVGDEILLVWDKSKIDMIRVSGRGAGVYRRMERSEAWTTN